jgi:AcrR family transcriptional regulator
MARSEDKQRRILKIAEERFRARGVKGTTLAEVAKASDAALGSLTHYFGGKRELAAAVLDQVLERLAEAAGTALRPKRTTVAEDIRALRKTCLEWPSQYGPLIATLEPYAAASWRGRSTRLHDRLGSVISEWAARRGSSDVARLSAGQLFAVVLGPVLCPMTATDRAQLRRTKNGLDQWLDMLAAMAMTAIKPPDVEASLAGNRAGPTTRKESREATRQGDLF